MIPAPQRRRPVCKECGGSNLVFDATAQWDDKRQEMELCDVQEASICGDCDGPWGSNDHWEYYE
jgi:hypothetical protein